MITACIFIDFFMSNWWVYICRCADNSLYTGITTDLERRLHQHNHEKTGARYTRSRRPVSLVYQEPAESRQQALSRERSIKLLKRDEKERLLLTRQPTTK